MHCCFSDATILYPGRPLCAAEFHAAITILFINTQLLTLPGSASVLRHLL